MQDEIQQGPLPPTRVLRLLPWLSCPLYWCLACACPEDCSDCEHSTQGMAWSLSTMCRNCKSVDCESEWNMYEQPDNVNERLARLKLVAKLVSAPPPTW